jgi:hypothetical protein
VSNDEFVLDLTHYKDRSGSRVTPGRYLVTIEDAEMAQTSGNPPKPMINIFLRVVGGEFDGSTIIDRLLPAHEKVLFRVVGFMQALGLPTPRRSMRINTKAFIGKSVLVDVEDGDPYNGRVKSEVRGYIKPEQGKGAPARPTEGGDELAGLAEFAPDAPAAPATPETSKAPDLPVDGTDEVDLNALDLG